MLHKWHTCIARLLQQHAWIHTPQSKSTCDERWTLAKAVNRPARDWKAEEHSLPVIAHRPHLGSVAGDVPGSVCGGGARLLGFLQRRRRCVIHLQAVQSGLLNWCLPVLCGRLSCLVPPQLCVQDGTRSSAGAWGKPLTCGSFAAALAARPAFLLAALAAAPASFAFLPTCRSALQQ